jgi:hypothetical protein
MDTVSILRDLWRHRLLVAGVCVLAVLAGAAVKLTSHRYTVGVATAHILVDTPSSQVVDVSPKGSDSLGVRANLLASLMIDGVVKSAIASRAGVQPDQFIGQTSAATSLLAGSGATPIPAKPGPRDYVLSTQVLTNSAGNELPIIQLDVQAPDRAGADKLAAAAIAGLGDYLNSTAAQQRIRNADRLHVSSLGAPQATTEVRGLSPSIAIVVGIAVFLLGCGCILTVLAVVRGWRAASARDKLTDAGLLGGEFDAAPDEFLHAEDPAPATRPAEGTNTARSAGFRATWSNGRPHRPSLDSARADLVPIRADGAEAPAEIDAHQAADVNATQHGGNGAIPETMIVDVARQLRSHRPRRRDETSP